MIGRLLNLSKPMVTLRFQMDFLIDRGIWRSLSKPFSGHVANFRCDAISLKQYSRFTKKWGNGQGRWDFFFKPFLTTIEDLNHMSFHPNPLSVPFFSLDDDEKGKFSSTL